jgi:fucose 4-O-acetylase-like acetyltransferase
VHLKQRIEIIDVVRGISIILVIIGHLPSVFGYGGLLSDLSLFRMPLFFFISGTIFSVKKPVGFFILQKSDQLLKPYLVTLLFLVILNGISSNHVPLQELIGIAYGNRDTIEWKPLWYLTHLWLVFIFSYLFCKYSNITERPFGQRIFIISILFIIGCLISNIMSPVTIDLPQLSNTTQPTNSSGLPFRFESLLISASFFLLGSTIKEYVKNFSPNALGGVIAFSVFLFSAILTPAYVDLGKGEYQYPWYALPASLSGIYGVIFAAYYVRKLSLLKQALITCGESSLFILIFHWFIQFKLYSLATKILGEEFILLSSAIALAGGIIIPIGIRSIIQISPLLSNFYFPIVGKPISLKPLKTLKLQRR